MPSLRLRRCRATRFHSEKNLRDVSIDKIQAKSNNDNAYQPDQNNNELVSRQIVPLN